MPSGDNAILEREETQAEIARRLRGFKYPWLMSTARLAGLLGYHGRHVRRVLVDLEPVVFKGNTFMYRGEDIRRMVESWDKQ